MKHDFSQLTGNSETMQSLREQVKRIARLKDTVLILGQRGTGKELVARALHDHSCRRGGAFVVVDCSALTESVFESELFGHERGSFTGAHKRKIGLLEDAQEELSFDEVSHLRLPLQGKLLRFLESKTIRRVGGRVHLDIDTRIVVASNRDLGEMEETGEFLPDLLDRLNVLRVDTPALQEHLDDIPVLVDHFARLHSLEGISEAMSPGVLNTLRGYDWPGNVRQLLNVLRRVASQGAPGEISQEDFEKSLRVIDL